MTKKYILPKGYLSWSQIDTWLTSKKKYIDQYVYGKPRFETKEMKFGQYFARGVETGDSNDESIKNILPFVPKLTYKEHELKVTVNDIPLDIVFDSVDSGVFYEYKTGKTPWDRERAENHKQLDFYTLGYYEEFGHFPKCMLVWLPTEDVDGAIRLTGDIHMFPVEKTMEDINEMTEITETVAREITEMMEGEIKNHDCHASPEDGCVVCEKFVKKAE